MKRLKTPSSVIRLLTFTLVAKPMLERKKHGCPPNPSHPSMTREYALMRLLQHGALTTNEIYQITGWTHHTANRVLQRLQEKLLVEWLPKRAGFRQYQLTELAYATGLPRLPVPMPVDDFTPETMWWPVPSWNEERLAA